VLRLHGLLLQHLSLTLKHLLALEHGQSRLDTPLAAVCIFRHGVAVALVLASQLLALAAAGAVVATMSVG
jgi:hypothetical protein